MNTYAELGREPVGFERAVLLKREGIWFANRLRVGNPRRPDGRVDVWLYMGDKSGWDHITREVLREHYGPEIQEATCARAREAERIR